MLVDLQSQEMNALRMQIEERHFFEADTAV